MLKAIVWKEFRELLPAVVVAVMLQMILLYFLVGPGSNAYHVPPDQIQATVSILAQIGVLFAAVFGVWQNKTEKNQGTFLFLLHRPARRDAIVGSKLLAGVGLCLLTLVLPLACVTYWAEVRVLARSGGQSFLWLVSAPVCLSIVLIYLGAFMSSLREASWYKSQFLPLFAAIAIGILLAILANIWTPFVLIAMPIVQACFVVAIFYEAVTRSYS